MSKRRFFQILSAIFGVIGAFFLALYISPRLAAESCTNIADLPIVDNGTWDMGSIVPTSRSEIKATVLDDRIYVAGGLLSRFEPSDFFAYLDTTTGEWHEAAPLPIGLHHVGMAALDGKIYVAGGYSLESNWNADVTAAWVYSPETDSWSSIADMPSSRAGHEMVNVDGHLYVLGGLGSDADSLAVYDAAADAWETRADMPNPSDHLAATALDGKLYAIGGRWSQGNIPTLQIYDPETDTWEIKQEMPTARSGFTSGVINGKIHVVGGESLTSTCTYSQHEVYDPETDTWTRLPDLPTSRHGLASAVVNNQWYVIGGATGAGGQTGATLSDHVNIFSESSMGE